MHYIVEEQKYRDLAAYEKMMWDVERVKKEIEYGE